MSFRISAPQFVSSTHIVQHCYVFFVGLSLDITQTHRALSFVMHPLSFSCFCPRPMFDNEREKRRYSAHAFGPFSIHGSRSVKQHTSHYHFKEPREMYFLRPERIAAIKVANKLFYQHYRVIYQYITSKNSFCRHACAMV